MITYTDTAQGIKHIHLEGFFEGWLHPPSTATHLAILQSSAVVILAVDDEADRVVGFVTAISDGVLAAYIPFLEVLPGYRGRGIGRELMRRVLDALAGLYMIDLVCDDDVRPFYEKLGMQAMTAMGRRDMAAQSGRPGGPGGPGEPA